MINKAIRLDGLRERLDLRQTGARGRVTRILIQVFLYALLIGAVYVFLFPFLYMLITSVKSSKDLSDVSVNWIPTSLKFSNFTIAARVLNYGTAFVNTLTMTLLSDLGHVLSCSMAGYAFARYRFKGQNVWFVIVLLTIIVPVQNLIIPTYLMFAQVKLVNSFWPIVLPTFFGVGLRGGLLIFVFRQFFLGMPKEIEEAAKVDGCSFLRAFFTIVVPIARPTILVVCVLSTVWHWNSSFEPSIFISKEALKPLSTRIDQIVAYVNNPPMEVFDGVSAVSEQVINIAVLMAGCFLILVPLIVMFGIVQRWFMEGVERSGLVE